MTYELVCCTGPYEARSMKVLKKNGHFAHVLNQGWLPKVGVYADGPLEMLCVLKGYAAAVSCHTRPWCIHSGKS